MFTNTPLAERIFKMHFELGARDNGAELRCLGAIDTGVEVCRLKTI
jgi:hypothetical protein